VADGHVLLATMGSGKSQAAPMGIYEHLVARTADLNRPCVALMASPTREQAIAQGVPCVVDVLGRDASNCHQPNVCAAAALAGYEPMAVVCSRCQYHPSKAIPRSRACVYMLRLEALLKTEESVEAFCCYEAVPHLAGKLADRRPELVLIAFDEDPVRYAVERHSLDLQHFYLSTEGLGDLDPVTTHIIHNEATALFEILRRVSTEVAESGVELPRAVCAPFYRRLEEVLREMRPGTGLDDLLAPKVSTALSEAIILVRKQGIVGGVKKLQGRKPRPWMPRLVDAMRDEYDRYKAGQNNWNYRVLLAADENGMPELRFTERRELPPVGKVLVLDGTARVERLRRALPGILFREERIDVATPNLTTVHLRRRASRFVVKESETRAKLVQDVVEVTRVFVPTGSSTLVVSYGNKGDRVWEEELATAIRETGRAGNVTSAHYGELRGSNLHEDIDVIVTVGDNEPPPFGLLDDISALYADDPEPLSLEWEEYAGHRRYKDERVRIWAERSTVEELAQVAFRHRPCGNPGRIFIHVGMMWPGRFLGPPTTATTPRRLAGDKVLAAIRAFIERHGWITKVVLVAAGYVKADDMQEAGEAVLRLLRDEYGQAFRAVSRPYSDRGLRLLMAQLDPRPRGFRVSCDPALGVGEKLHGWGDRREFETAWRRMLEPLAVGGAENGARNTAEGQIGT